jgi:hypothetical protein
MSCRQSGGETGGQRSAVTIAVKTCDPSIPLARKQRTKDSPTAAVLGDFPVFRKEVPFQLGLATCAALPTYTSAEKRKTHSVVTVSGSLNGATM